MAPDQENQRTLPPRPIDTPGLISGVSGVARNLFGLIVSRLELAALELSEVRTNLLKLVLFGAIGVFAALFAVAYWTVLIVYLSWDALGWKILLIMSLVFTAATVAVMMYAKSLLTEGKLSIPATLAELGRDRDALL